MSKREDTMDPYMSDPWRLRGKSLTSSRTKNQVSLIHYGMPWFSLDNKIALHWLERSVHKVDIYCLTILYLRNTKHVPRFYRVIETRVEVWENEKCCGNTSRKRVLPQLFRVLPNFHERSYNSIETRRTCFLFLLENTTTRNYVNSSIVLVLCFYRVLV